MNIDLSTMSLTGLIAVVIFCTAFVIALVLLLRAKPKIKGSKGSIEIGEDLKDNSRIKVEVTPHKIEVDMLRQLVMARNEIEGIIGQLYDVIIEGANLTDEQKTIAELRCELFGSRLLYSISRCYTTNNIGKTLEDIEAYAGRTARELNYLFDVFPDTYNLKNKLEGNWLKKVLFTIIRDGKGL